MAIAASVFLDWGLFSVFDVDAEAVRRHLPTDVGIVTDDAGKATLSLNIAHFLEGGEGVELPQNHEIDLGVAVNVDNTLYAGCPQATTASHVLNIASTSADYLAYCKEAGYNKASGEGLRSTSITSTPPSTTRRDRLSAHPFEPRSSSSLLSAPPKTWSMTTAAPTE